VRGRPGLLGMFGSPFFHGRKWRFCGRSRFFRCFTAFVQLYYGGTMRGFLTPNVRARASHVDCSFQSSSSIVEGVSSQRISVLAASSKGDADAHTATSCASACFSLVFRVANVRGRESHEMSRSHCRHSTLNCWRMARWICVLVFPACSIRATEPRRWSICWRAALT